MSEDETPAARAPDTESLRETSVHFYDTDPKAAGKTSARRSRSRPRRGVARIPTGVPTVLSCPLVRLVVQPIPARDDGRAIAPGVVTRASIALRSFPSVDEPMVQKWMRFRNTIVADHSVAHTPDRATSTPGDRPARALIGPSEGVVVYWRFVASNNRELGRSSFLYQSVEQAARHVERIIGSVARLRADTLTDATPSRRGWVMTLDGVPVMTSARWYSSSSSCAASAALALSSLRDARLVSPPPTHGHVRRVVAADVTGDIVQL